MSENCTILVLFVLGVGQLAWADQSETIPIVRAADFGLKADGTADDGPAIERVLHAVESAGTPVQVVFPQRKTIRIATANQRYALRFDGLSHVTVDGGGCTFLLAPSVRFLKMTACTDFVLRNLNVDFEPLPFADGTVVAVDPQAKSIDVRLASGIDGSPGKSLPIGGSTREDGEQAFFGVVWYPGRYGLLTHHYWIERMERLPPEAAVHSESQNNADSPPIIRAWTNETFRGFNSVRPNETKVSLPIPGIAHRFGPGSCFEIWDNNNVSIEHVELWSAPWFGFRVFRNRGEVTFRGVHIRPKPDSGRLTSTWRDGFHVKGNSASLLWEDCIISATHDDAFNISHHCSRVQQVISPTKIIVQQTYPLNVMPWHEGGLLLAADHHAGTLLGQSRIRKVTCSQQQRMIGDKPAASPVTLELQSPVAGLARGIMVWEPAYANPDTTLRRCQIEKSCRLQSPVTLDSCDVTALLWFYSERIEGPFPGTVAVRNCRLRRGRGNPKLALSFVGRRDNEPGSSALQEVILQDNEIWGTLSVQGVDDLRIAGNRFCEKEAGIHLRGNRSVKQSGNRDADGQPLSLVNR